MTVPSEAVAHPSGRLRRVGLWLDDRFGLSALAYPVPVHANRLAYTLGGVTLGSFLLLVGSGIYLAQLYDPTPAGAHASVVHLSQEPAGAIVRSLHFWLAGIFIVTLLLHLLRTFVTAAYKRPREGVWLTGIVLFLLAGGLLFTGTILKWDQEAVEAYGHNVELSKLLGVAGFWLSNTFSDTVPLLTRTYITHISLLPLALAGLAGLHLLLVKKQKISPLPVGTPEEIARREQAEPTLPFTTHLYRILYWTLIVLGLALALTALRPTGIGPQGVEGIEISKPPWDFLWLYPFEDWFGLKALVVAPAILIAGLIALPFLDRSGERDPRRRRPWMALAALVLVAWAALSVFAFVSVPVSHLGMESSAPGASAGMAEENPAQTAKALSLQALALLVQGRSHEEAVQKLDRALASGEKGGVDLRALRSAHLALHHEDAAEARRLLEQTFPGNEKHLVGVTYRPRIGSAELAAGIAAAIVLLVGIPGLAYRRRLERAARASMP